MAKKRFCHQTEWKDCRGFAEGLLFALSLVGVAYKMRGMWLPLGTSIVGFYINFGSAKIEENAQELRKAIPRIVRNGIIITGVLLVCKCLDKVMTENSVVIGLPWTLAFVGVMMLALGAWVKRDKLYDVCAHYPVKYWKEKDAI